MINVLGTASVSAILSMSCELIANLLKTMCAGVTTPEKFTSGARIFGKVGGFASGSDYNIILQPKSPMEEPQ
jgi:hypothetical protein